ncbi:MAG: Fic family protein [Thermoplasmata archaeon]
MWTRPSFEVYFTFVSQKMCGCSLTLLEATRLLENGRKRWEKPVADNIETRSHYELFKTVLAQENDLSVGTINDWHWKLFRKTKPSVAGLFRNSEAKTSFGEYSYPDPAHIDSMLQGFFSWYEDDRSLHPVMLAGIVHSRLLMIHPFATGNGRIARLALNFVLHRYGYPMYGFN